MGSSLQVHSAPLVRGVLLINVFLCCVGLLKWLSKAPFLCLQAAPCRHRCGFCLDIQPQCCRRTLTQAFRAHSDLVGLVKRCIKVILYLLKQMMQGRAGKKTKPKKPTKQKKKNPRRTASFLEILQILCSLGF